MENLSEDTTIVEGQNVDIEGMDGLTVEAGHVEPIAGNPRPDGVDGKSIGATETSKGGNGRGKDKKKRKKKSKNPEFGQSSPTYEELLSENAKLKTDIGVLRDCSVSEDYQPVIDAPPASKKDLWAQCTSGDGKTIDSWRDEWIQNIKWNADKFDIKNNTVMSEHLKNQYRPAIIAGSGPSLKKNIGELSKNQGDICLVSCLHNYGFFEDNGVHPDYYVNLDAGDITVPEMSQGGKKHPDYYWDSTVDKVLINATVSNPTLTEKWKGKVLWFMAPTPDESLGNEMLEIIGTRKFPMFSVGGNTLGGCLYMAKTILGSNPIAFVGADFCFSHGKKYHPFDSPYDKMYGGLMPAVNVYGNRVGCWQSYWNFKCWFDFIACGGQNDLPGIYVNCTEGGLLGAYPEGNIKQIIQMKLKDFLDGYHMSNKLQEVMDQHDNPVVMF